MDNRVLTFVLISIIAFLSGFAASYLFPIQTPFVDVPFSVLAIGLILGGAAFFGYLGFIPALLLGLQLGAEKNAAVFIYIAPVILAIYAGTYIGVLINKDFERKEIFAKKAKNIIVIVAIALVISFAVEMAVPYTVEYWPKDYLGMSVGGGYMSYDSDLTGENIILRGDSLTIPIELKQIVVGKNNASVFNTSTNAILKIKDADEGTPVYGAEVTATSQSGNEHEFIETSSGMYKKDQFPFGEQVTLIVKSKGYEEYNKKVTFNRDIINEISLTPEPVGEEAESSVTIRVFGSDGKTINQAKVTVYNKETSATLQIGYTQNGQITLKAMTGTRLRIVVEKGSTAAGLIGKLASLKRR